MEAFPFAKVGGLADVAGALPKALHEMGIDVRIILPHYQTIDDRHFGITPLDEFPETTLSLSGERNDFRINHTVIPDTNIPVYFVQCESFFGRRGIYVDPDTQKAYSDNGERMIFFCRSVVEFIRTFHWTPDVFHCHDAHTSFVIEYLTPRWNLLSPTTPVSRGTILTIHNIGGAYQGVHPKELLRFAGIDGKEFYPGSIYEFWGKTNLMKVGIYTADIINTVSERYAEEISTLPEYGNGLEGILYDRREDLYGILNGIDETVWNPQSDPHIFQNYDRSTIDRKERNKAGLMKQAGFAETSGRVPLIGMISRLVDQKGFDLIRKSFLDLMGMDMKLIILGTGQKEYEDFFLEMNRLHGDRFYYCNEFNDRLAHRIEAGCDLFLMPSRYEPCGLNQMYSLKYGTIPVVRSTGGLSDTVRDVQRSPKRGNGFKFRAYSAAAMLGCLGRACSVYRNPRMWHLIQRNAMSEDFSWRKSAERYIELYRKALGKR
jgi:starch synthase